MTETPNSIDWNAPLEAVKIGTDIVVPVTFASEDRLTNRFYTNECPDPDTTNSAWNADGSDYCCEKQWFVRNVQPTNTVTIPHTAAEVRAKAAELGDGSNSNRTHEFIGKLIEYGFLQTPDTPATLLSQNCNITEEQAAKALEWMRKEYES